MTYKHGAQDYI